MADEPDQQSKQEQIVASTKANQESRPETPQVEASAEPITPPVKSRKKQGAPANTLTGKALEKAISPNPSLWPFALAFSMILLCLGVIIHPVVMGTGILLCVVSIVAWALERR